MTMRALQAADELTAHHVDVAVVHTPTIKPFDAETVLGQVNSDRLALTLENHTVVGGLFETVASAAVRRGIAKQITPIGLPDEFLEPVPCRHCTTGTACRRRASSGRCSHSCKIGC